MSALRRTPAIDACKRKSARAGLGAFILLGVVGFVEVAHGADRQDPDALGLEKPAVSDGKNGAQEPELASAEKLVVQMNSLAARGTSEIISGLSREQLTSLIGEIIDLQGVAEKLSRSIESEADGKSSAGLFQIAGEIKQRDSTKVVLWGYALPVNFDSKQLGSQNVEGNLVVLNPNLDGIRGGVRYDATHAFVQTERGTNAFGATVPVLIYGDIPASTRDRIKALKDGQHLLSKASSKLYRCYARIRRAILADREDSRARTSDLDPNSVSNFINSIASSAFDWEFYFKQGQPAFGGDPLGYLNLRTDLSSQWLHAFGTGYEEGYGDTGIILGFGREVLGWRTRIHDRELLARYFPEGASKFVTSAVVPLPIGSETLVSVLLSEGGKSRCSAMENYTSNVQQNARCSEIVNVRLMPKPSSGKDSEITFLCYWMARQRVC